MIDSCRPLKVLPGMAATYSMPRLRITSTMKSLPQVVCVGPSRFGATCGGAPCSEAREVICTGDFLPAAGAVSAATAAPTALAPAAMAPVPASVAALRNFRRPVAGCSVSLLLIRRAMVSLHPVPGGAADYRVCTSRCDAWFAVRTRKDYGLTNAADRPIVMT